MGSKNEHVKTKNVFQMKENTYTTTHQKKKTDIDTHTIMYQAKFAGRHTESKSSPEKSPPQKKRNNHVPAKFRRRPQPP